MLMGATKGLRPDAERVMRVRQAQELHVRVAVHDPPALPRQCWGKWKR
jgi:hypothetical protein